MNPFIDDRMEDAYEESPLVLVDIGSSGGLPPVWRPAEAHLRMVAFDPDPRAASEQGRPGWTYLGSGLHRDRRKAALHLTRKQQCSSIFEPNREFLRAFPDPGRYDVVDRREIECDSLDAQLAAAGIASTDFVKLDAQGAELYILEGGPAILETALGLEVEVEFAPIYIDQPLFADVDTFLRRRGFQLMDLNPCYWKRQSGALLRGSPGQLVFADAVYLRTIESTRAMLANLPRAEARNRLLHAVAICVLYGHLGYALDLVEVAGGVLMDGEEALILRVMNGYTMRSSRLPLFRGRGLVFRALRRVSAYFQTPSWSEYSPLLPPD
jgi:FkbM family methyltransferase